MTLTNEELKTIYTVATGEQLDPVNLGRAKSFINELFNHLTPDAYIDSDGTAERDAFMLIGNNPTKLYSQPDLEN